MECQEHDGKPETFAEDMDMKRNNIVLVGFMGTGKSTVSRLLADKLDGWTAVDTDLLIEEREAMTIPDIFAKYGEAHFRRTESRVIAEVTSRMRQVIATGGGAVLDPGNRERMLAGGFVVALTAAMETIIRRVRSDENRPLLHGNVEERVKNLLEARKNAYDFADIKIDTTDLTADEVAETILRARAKLLSLPTDAG
mgnify:CR=1 FL=1|jgi:shikimate kinase